MEHGNSMPFRKKLAHIIDRCLAKNAEDRWNSAWDVKLELAWARQQRAPASTRHSKSRLWVTAVSFAVMVVAAVLFIIFRLRRTGSTYARPSTLAITAAEGVKPPRKKWNHPDAAGRTSPRHPS